MKLISYWLDDFYAPRPSLSGEIHTDVVIVGGGITGVSAAYHCAKQGLKTVLLEKNTIASGAAGKNGGMIVEGFSTPFISAVEQVGYEAAKEGWERTVEARDLVKALIKEHAIDCDFEQPGSLLVASSESENEFLRSEVAARIGAGFEAELLEPGFQMKMSPFGCEMYTTGGCAMHPVKFVRGLACVAEEYGATIHEETPALSVHAHSVTTPNGVVYAKKIVLALEGNREFTSSDNVTITHEQAIVTEPLSDDQIAGLDWKTGGMFWTFGEDYYNIRKIGSRLFTSGRISPDSTEGDLERHRKHLLEIIAQRLPSLRTESLAISHCWTAVTVKPSSEQPVMRERDGITELFGNGDFGFTNGIMAGKRAAEAESFLEVKW